MSKRTNTESEFSPVQQSARELGGSLAALLSRTLEQTSTLVEHVLTDSGHVAADARRLSVSVLDGLREELLSRGKDVRATRQQ